MRDEPLPHRVAVEFMSRLELHEPEVPAPEWLRRALPHRLAVEVVLR